MGFRMPVYGGPHGRFWESSSSNSSQDYFAGLTSSPSLDATAASVPAYQCWPSAESRRLMATLFTDATAACSRSPMTCPRYREWIDDGCPEV